MDHYTASIIGPPDNILQSIICIDLTIINNLLLISLRILLTMSHKHYLPSHDCFLEVVRNVWQLLLWNWLTMLYDVANTYLLYHLFPDMQQDTVYHK